MYSGDVCTLLLFPIAVVERTRWRVFLERFAVCEKGAVRCKVGKRRGASLATAGHVPTCIHHEPETLRSFRRRKIIVGSLFVSRRTAGVIIPLPTVVVGVIDKQRVICHSPVPSDAENVCQPSLPVKTPTRVSIVWPAGRSHNRSPIGLDSVVALPGWQRLLVRLWQSALLLKLHLLSVLLLSPPRA